MRKIEPAVHGGNLTQAAQAYGLAPTDFIDFSANISWLGVAPGTEEAIWRGIRQMQHYPDSTYHHLRETIAREVQLPMDHLVVGNGSIELIYALMRGLGPKRALVLEPTFNEYARAVKLAGGEVEYFPLEAKDNWQIDVDELAKRFDQVDVLFLCNPNNPTGQMISRADLMNVLQQAEKQGLYLVIDEAFLDFLEDFAETNYGILDLVTSSNRLVVLRSFTKFFAIPGLRLGFCAANPDLIEKIAWAKEPWTVNCLAQEVGELIVAPELMDFRNQVREKIRQAREDFKLNLSQICQVQSWGEANYLLLDLGEGINSTELTKMLGYQGILVRDCAPFAPRLNRYIRVAVRSPEENSRLVGELRHVLQQARPNV